MTTTINKGKDGITYLTVTIPVETPKASKSGKNVVIASTQGNRKTECQFDGKTVIVGLNAYIKPVEG